MAKRSTCNLDNRTIFCRDNIDILRGINGNCIDLIYLDPPFNTNKTFTAPIGSSAEGAEFSDIFREEDLKEEWVEEIRAAHYEIHELLKAVKQIEGRTSYNFCYLAYMTIRLTECHRILKDTGSIYLHCDPTMSHHLKLVLDCVFGQKNFNNEIVWGYNRFSRRGTAFASMHDIILFYGKSRSKKFNKPTTAARNTERYERGYHVVTDQGETRLLVYDRKKAAAKIAEAKKMGRAIKYTKAKEPTMGSVWSDIPIINPGATERTGYPTQKPLALLERIIEASSGKGDMVLDPFCGCATTCVAAEKLERQWIGVDVSQKAFEMVKERLQREVPADLFRGEPNFSTTPPKRTDPGASQREERFVYVISNAKYPGEYKVGIATDVNKRLGSYQTGDPERGFKIEFKIKTSKFREAERAIHDRFENKHEWIRGDLDAIIRDIKRLAK